MGDPKTRNSGGDAALERELAGLKAEYERLREEKVRAEQDLANLTGQLADLERKALEEYGVSDPEALERLLAEKRAENERLVAGYRAHIDGVKNELGAVEGRFKE